MLLANIASVGFRLYKQLIGPADFKHILLRESSKFRQTKIQVLKQLAVTVAVVTELDLPEGNTTSPT